MGWILLGLSAAVAFGLFALVVLRRRCFITLEDAISVPGRDVTLRVQVEKKLLPFWDPSARGAFLRIKVNGRFIEAKKTDSNGRAEVVVSSEAPGVIPIEAELEEGRFHAPAVKGRVDVVEPDHPILIVDIDMTISNMTNFRQAISPVEKVPPIEGSQDVLNRLANDFKIVYLSARDSIYMEKSRKWLSHCGFPGAPIFLRRLRYWEAKPQKHKELRLDETISIFTGPKAGVGDKMSDVLAYQASGMKAVYFGPEKHPDLPEGALYAATWKEVEALLKPSENE